MRSGDDDWLTLVRWVLFALIAAEEHGITRDNVRAIRETTEAPRSTSSAGSGRRVKSRTRDDPEWALRAVEKRGQLWRTLRTESRAQSPFNSERGLNRLLDTRRPDVTHLLSGNQRGVFMSELQMYVTLATFGAVILVIAFDVIDHGSRRLAWRERAVRVQYPRRG